MEDDLRLLTEEQVRELLQLEPADLDWLVSTRQLTRFPICGKQRFLSTDIFALIATYKQITERKN